MRRRDYVTINVYWLGLSFMWNGLHPILLPDLLLRFVPESLKNTYLGGMTFAGLILAMIVQPLAGALSDRTTSRWGKRRPWILFGTLFDLVFLAGMALAGSYVGVLIAYILLQIASNSAHGPAQGLIPDLVPEERRGLASGLKNLFDMAGVVIASLLIAQLVEAGNYVFAFAITGAVLVVGAAITILGTPERRDTNGPISTVRPGLMDLIRADWRRYPDYTKLIISRFMILAGIYAVQSFAQYFIRDMLAVPNAVDVTGKLMTTIGLTLIALVFPAGMLSDRIGRRRLNLLSGATAGVGIVLLATVRDVTWLYIFGAVIGMATGTFLSVNWALATDLIPQEEAGKYLGLSNLATAGAGAISRLGGPLIDGVNALRPGQYLGYPTLFVVASISTLVGTLLLRRIREFRSEPSSPQEHQSG